MDLYLKKWNCMDLYSLEMDLYSLEMDLYSLEMDLYSLEMDLYSLEMDYLQNTLLQIFTIIIKLILCFY